MSATSSQKYSANSFNDGASPSQNSSTNSFEDRATISHELALQRLKIDLNTCLPDSWRSLVLNKKTIGLSRMTPLGIGCSWYTDQTQWFDISATLHQQQPSEISRLLRSLVGNIVQEEDQLTTELMNKSTGPKSDVLSAFQPISDIKPSKRGSDGRIRRAHMMNCVVDRLLWASQSSGTTTTLPTQLPHHRFPEDALFSEYVEVMQTWHRLVWDISTGLDFKQVEFVSSDSTNNVALSLFKSVLSSSIGRKLHTLIENFSRCALGLRALSCVSLILTKCLMIIFRDCM
jgi:hypothetical protein